MLKPCNAVPPPHPVRRGRQWPLLWLLLALVPLFACAGQPLRVAVISDLNGDYGSTRYEAAVDAAVSVSSRCNPTW